MLRRQSSHACSFALCFSCPTFQAQGSGIKFWTRFAASASSDMIRWSRVLLSHTLDAARSY